MKRSGKLVMDIPVLDYQRLGQYNRNKKRPVRVTFLFMKHKNCLLTRKRNLPTGIYVEEAYPELIKQKRASLRPILKYALKTEGYKGKCKMEHDHLIIKGTKYTTDTLHKLPEDIAPYKANQKSNHKCLIFHGQHTPLSNFHHSHSTSREQNSPALSSTYNIKRPATSTTIPQLRKSNKVTIL